MGYWEIPTKVGYIKYMIQEKLEEFKTLLDLEMKQQIQNVYGEFIKAPIDTGNMLDSTRLVGVIYNVENMSIRVAVDTTEYAKYVRFPESSSNPNYKYGPRDFIQAALNLPNVQQVRNELINEMTKEYLKLDQPIRNIKIKL